MTEGRPPCVLRLRPVLVLCDAAVHWPRRCCMLVVAAECERAGALWRCWWAVTEDESAAAAGRPGEWGRLLRRWRFAPRRWLAQWCRLRWARGGMVAAATDPFAARVSVSERLACDAVVIPRLVFSRSPWVAAADDRWREVPDIARAAAILPQLGARIFLSIGSQQLAAFAGLRGVHLVVRMIDSPKTELPLADYSVILGRGPFCEAAETDLLRGERIDAVVSRNSGGNATFAKIAAARNLRLPVVMIAPPPPERGQYVETLEEALQWVVEKVEGGEH